MKLEDTIEKGSKTHIEKVAAPLSFEDYLFQMRHSKLTVKSYLYSVSIFLSERKNALHLNYKDIITYLSEKEKAYGNPNIKKQILFGIKKYYDYLIEIGARNDHPCQRLYVKRNKSNAIILQDLFSTAELEMLLNREERYPALKQRNQAILSLLIYQGLRAGEIADLKIQDIDFDKGLIFVKGSRKNAQRHLEILPKQYRLLERYINESRNTLKQINSDVFAIGKQGNALTIEVINYLVGTYKPLFPDRNLNPQTIRQSVIANWMNEKKLPLEQVQIMAGHKWISATEKYRQINNEEQKMLMNKWFPL